jgi:hypothetical protein
MEILYPYSWWKKINLAASSFTYAPGAAVTVYGLTKSKRRQIAPFALESLDAHVTYPDFLFVFPC